MVEDEKGFLAFMKRFSRWNRISEEMRTDILYLSLLFGVILVFFWRVILNPDEIIYSSNSDTIEQFYPWHHIADQAVRNGTFPFWNVYNFGGEPLLANMQLCFFYPPNMVLFTILPVHTVFGYSFILHLFFAGSCTYYLAKRSGLHGITAFLPGAVFIFSGYFMGHIYAGHYGQVCSASWIPMVLLVLDTALRRMSLKWGVMLGVVVGVQFLAGHIQITLFSGLICLVYFIYFLVIERGDLRIDRKWMKLSAVPIIAIPVAFLIALIQFVLSYIYTGATTRSGGMSYDFVTSYSLPPQNILTLLLPNLFGTPLEGNYWHLWNYWELSFYMGVFTLVLIYLSFRYRKDRYFRFFMILGIFSLIMALGKYTPVYWIFYKIVPGFDILRVPSRFVLIFILCASILAGFGLKRLIEDPDRSLRKRIEALSNALIIVIVVLGSLSLLMAIFQNSAVDYIHDTLDEVLEDEELLSIGHSIVNSAYLRIIWDIITLMTILLVTYAILKWRNKKKEVPGYFGVVVVSFILLNLGWVHMDLIDTEDPDDIYFKEPYIQFLVDNTGDYRVYDASDMIEDNYQIIYGFKTVKGYNPLELEYYQELTDRIRNLSGNRQHPVLNMLGARYIVTTEELVGSGFDSVFGPKGEDKVRIYENPKALPMLFLVHNVTITDEENILKRLSAGELEPSEEVLMESIPSDFEPTTQSDKKGVIRQFERPFNNEVRIDVETPSNGILVLSQSYYDEWDVYVDGEERELLRVFHGLTGVSIQGGNHSVRFVYDDLL